ncbi:hypothetical protein AVEN_70883-1 [Araneus ventricosus]|uniref:Uncharacterized protein n=1 Tax=Araneus ventricosus TaxID=182803 RepID=A0A4Y2LAN4_ARAVE|nr:hypothetical protein AVEN_70883-1 [Araneus ventricosus]
MAPHLPVAREWSQCPVKAHNKAPLHNAIHWPAVVWEEAATPGCGASQFCFRSSPLRLSRLSLVVGGSDIIGILGIAIGGSFLCFNPLASLKTSAHSQRLIVLIYLLIS